LSDEINRTSINPFKDDITGRVLLGRYRVVRRLAAGGMGVVYLARLEGAAGFVKPVVVKLVLPILQANEEFSGMFAREARILADLQHPGIVGIIEFAEELDCNIMVLEYVNGFSLGDWKNFLMSKGRMIPTSVAIQIAVNTLDALHFAHELKNHAGETVRVIHRDISPGNIMLDNEGHIKLVDFGIAFISEANEGYKTTDHSFKGKLAYSAPELFASGSASPKSDIYALGVTLHETLIGKNEFQFKDQAKVVHAALHHVASSIHTVRDDAPEAIDEVLWKALAKNPDHRFANASEFASALREISRIPEHKSLALLTDLVRQDFGDEMSRFLNIESLSSRERAWRFPSIVPKHIAENPETFNQPTVVSQEIKTRVAASNEIPTEPGSAPPPQKRTSLSKSLKIAVPTAILLAAAATAIAVWFLRPQKTDDRRFLLVQSEIPGDVQADDPSVKPKVPATVETAVPSAEVPSDTEVKTPKKKDAPLPKTSAVKKNKVQDDEVGQLTQAFKKRRNEVQACFEANPKDTEKNPSVSILFSVSADGHVDNASLSPPGTEGTPLGACLIGVSKKTVFPQRTDPVSFRIPVSARRVDKDAP
jgi:serine/threonine-protein kinase